MVTILTCWEEAVYTIGIYINSTVNLLKPNGNYTYQLLYETVTLHF
jgi:hypothetical protein